MKTLLRLVMGFFAINLWAVKPPQITTTSCPQGQNGVAYSICSVSAKWGTKPYTFSLASGSLPTGLGLATVNSVGKITGTPTVNGTFSFVIRVTDSEGAPKTDDQQLYIYVSGAVPPPANPVKITTSSIPSGLVGSAYSTTIQATAGSTPYTWSISSGLPPAGVTLNAGTGVLSGTPTAPSTSDFYVKVTDSSSPAGTAQQEYITVISNPSPTPTYLFKDDFESGTFGAWSNPTSLWTSLNPYIAQAPEPVHGGTYSYGQHYQLCGGCSGSDVNRFIFETVTNNLTTVYVRAYVYLKHPEAGATTNELRKYYWIQDSGNTWQFILNTQEYSGIQKFNAGRNGTCGEPQTNAFSQVGSIAFDSWHSVEMQVTLNTPGVADGTVKLWLDGVLVGSNTAYSIRGTCSGTIDLISVGRQAQRAVASEATDEYRYWDEIIVNNTGPIGP